jgi:hypothetical protein
MPRLSPALALGVAVFAWAPHALAASADVCAARSEEGQLHRLNGRLLQARAAFQSCVHESCPKVIRRDCAQFLDALEAAIPTVVLSARDRAGADLTDVKVTVDETLIVTKLDGKAQPIDPGIHVVRFEGNDAVVERTVVVKEGERNRTIEVVLDRPESREIPPAKERGDRPTGPPIERPLANPGPPIGAFVAGAVGVAALGAFVGFGLSARADLDDLRATCGTRCAEADVDRVRRKALYADVGLALSVIGIGISTWLFVDHATTRPKIDVQASPTGAFVGVVGAF